MHQGGNVSWAFLPCLEGGADNGKDWCTDPWCFVSADSECDEEDGAYDTAFFANTTYSDSLEFSDSVCTVYNGPTEPCPFDDGCGMESTSGESSSKITTGLMALVASAAIIATSVII